MKHGANISTVGITNKGGQTSHPKVKDESDAFPMKVRGGANIKKVSPGLNTQIVPLVTIDNA